MTTISNKRPIEGNKAEPTQKRVRSEELQEYLFEIYKRKKTNYIWSKKFIKDAISNGDTLLVQKLLDDGADFDAQINVTTGRYQPEYESGLIWAARNNQKEIADLIIAHNEDHQDTYGSHVSKLLELYFEQKDKYMEVTGLQEDMTNGFLVK